MNNISINDQINSPNIKTFPNSSLIVVETPSLSRSESNAKRNAERYL